MKQVKIILLCILTLVLSVLISFANAQPSPLTPEELGLIDALITLAVSHWREAGAVLYALTAARVVFPKSVAQKKGVRWLFWLWDRIAMNWGGAKNG